MNFSSENYDRVHPTILKALAEANKGFVPSYGKDIYTKQATDTFKKIFDQGDLEVFFCFNGTGSNNFAISSLAERHHSVLCADVSHIYTAESTAPETFSGCRLYPVQSKNGKIITNDILSQLSRMKGIHCPRATILTVSQPTEYGTVYNLKELKTISTICRQNNLMLHIDGARIFNALVSLNCSFSDFIQASGVDALTVGGTKSGLMFGEAVVFFRNSRFSDLIYNHKRSMQLASKSRFIAAQFNELLTTGLWKRIASHTNALARYFEQRIRTIHDTPIACPVETNMVFMNMDARLFRKLREVADFYEWDTKCDEVRFAFSFSNTKKEIDLFIRKYKEAISA
jgi:threonine aldolase